MTDDIRRIQGMGGLIRPEQKPVQDADKDKPKFNEIINGLVKDVDSLQKTAGQATEKLVSGEVEDVHQVMIAMEEASTSFKLLMEIRNKMVEAYKEVMKMQV